MSPPKNDRTIQSISGNSIQTGITAGAEAAPRTGEIASAISRALHAEYGDTHAAIKLIVRATGANERAARNWFEGRNAPSGESLIALCRSCDRVLEAVLILSGRTDILGAKRIVDAKEQLRTMLAAMDELTVDPDGS
jgi:hypothetical protein